MTTDSSPDPERDGNVPYVEYCLANVTADERAALEEADVPSSGVSCLDRCGRCYRTAFLVVDGTPIEGDRCERFRSALPAGDPG